MFTLGGDETAATVNSRGVDARTVKDSVGDGFDEVAVATWRMTAQRGCDECASVE